MEQKKSSAPFKFLTNEEFAALSQQEKIDYVRRAIEAMHDEIGTMGAPPAIDEPG